jgi:hypothetical protein
MFDYFGFDPRSLTDDDLANKLAELQAKVVYASRFSSPGLLESLHRIMQSLEFEQRERLLRRAQEIYNKSFPDVIETDPDLAEKKPTTQPGSGKIQPQPRPRMSITKTTRPTDPGTTGES